MFRIVFIEYPIFISLGRIDDSKEYQTLTPITHKSTQFQKLLIYSKPIDLISIASSIRKYITNAKRTISNPEKIFNAYHILKEDNLYTHLFELRIYFKSFTHQYIVAFGDISKQSYCFKASIRNNPTSRRKFEVDPENSKNRKGSYSIVYGNYLLNLLDHAKQVNVCVIKCKIQADVSSSSSYPNGFFQFSYFCCSFFFY